MPELQRRLLAPRATIEQFRLFIAYQHSRHQDSEMAAMTYGDYRGMIEDTALRSAVVEFRDPGGRLVAVSLIDRLDDGLSAVYTFYDPAHRPGGLGTWSILWLVEECRRQGLPYVYLGYWIAESPKMAYKARFPALERLTQASGCRSPIRRIELGRHSGAPRSGEPGIQSHLRPLRFWIPGSALWAAPE